MDFDIVLVGGGLANGLIALRLSQRRPDISVAIVESGSRVGGNHIWSSFDDDLSPEQREWTEPLIAHHWREYSVRFPKGVRTLQAGYRTATSGLLADAVERALPAGHIITDMKAVAFDATSVTLADQRVLWAKAVIDGRGLASEQPLDLRWQKFVGLELELENDHGLAGPIVMDATVAQLDGYRFVYTLPFGPRRVLVEDTYFSDVADLSAAAVRDRVLDYARLQGWQVARVGRQESGILPMALGGEAADLWAAAPEGVTLSGLASGLFHPATGYSFPDAVRTADVIAGLDVLDGPSIYAAQRDHSVAAWRDRGFYRYLNSMMFLGAEPDERYRVIERFYGLNPALVRRFYSGQSTPFDKLRTLVGKPPIPITRAARITLSVLQQRFSR
ncbi:lycopene beta-cyclase CrtY [Sphingomonas arantia]|uniref:Lycopene beta-cyclase CrtY n=1 Tax=Sphingomonas arantia TaxID=1460676 RepID=A0ABW4TUB0_9SPHN